MKNTITLSLLVLLITAISFAQNTNIDVSNQHDHPVLKYLPTEADAAIQHCGNELDTYQVIHQSAEQWNKQMQGKIAAWRKKASSSRQNLDITIPVVVHVLHNQVDGAITGNNISDEQIWSQIDRLNVDYAGLNEDLTDVPSEFTDVLPEDGMGVQFCLATVAPDGSATTGITRTYTTKTAFSLSADDAKFDATEGKDAWPRENYLNIWVVPSISGGFLGYAQFPAGNAATDGVVVADQYFGDGIGTASIGAFNMGRTTTHEIGHYLGLLHPFEDGCADGDMVADTPAEETPNFGCPTSIPESCGSLDMYVNYMDYSNDACLIMFTQGQKEFMELFLQFEPTRNTYFDAAATYCTDAALAANFDFTIPSTFCEGDILQLFDLSIGTPNTWNWTVSNATSSFTAEEQNASIVIAEAGIYNIVLTIGNASGNTQSLTVNNAFTVIPSADCFVAAPCTDIVSPLGGPFAGLNPLPCGEDCSDAYVSLTEIQANQAFTIEDLSAGDSYSFSICDGPNAGSWYPILTIARFTDGIIGEVLQFVANCSINFTAPDDGDYVLVVTEGGSCTGALPNGIGNGYLTVSCIGENTCPNNCLFSECVEATAMDIADGAINGPYSNLCAISSENDPSISDLAGCFFNDDALQNTIWLSFEGTGAAITLTTVTDCEGVSIPHGDTQMAVFTGGCSEALNLVACNDDIGGPSSNLLSSVEVNTVAGELYYVLIDGYNGELGEFCIAVSEPLVCNAGTYTAFPNVDVYEGEGTVENPFLLCEDTPLFIQTNADYVADPSFPNPGIMWGYYTAPPTNTNPLEDAGFTTQALGDSLGVLVNGGNALFALSGLPLGTYYLVPLINPNFMAGITVSPTCSGVVVGSNYTVVTYLPANSCIVEPPYVCNASAGTLIPPDSTTVAYNGIAAPIGIEGAAVDSFSNVFLITASGQNNILGFSYENTIDFAGYMPGNYEVFLLNYSNEQSEQVEDAINTIDFDINSFNTLINDSLLCAELSPSSILLSVLEEIIIDGISENPIDPSGYIQWHQQNGFIHLRWQNLTVAEVQVYNVSGQQMHIEQQMSNAAENLNIDVGRWLPGLYVVQLNTVLDSPPICVKILLY